MRNALQKTIDNDRLEKAIEVITTSEYYTLETFLKSNHLMDEYKIQGENILIECPYHTDETPSMSINLNKNWFKCFSCGEGGGYFKFINTYNYKVLGHKTETFSLVENIIKTDIRIRNSLGFNTVFVEKNLYEEFLEFKLLKPKLKLNTIPDNYIKLANRLKLDKKPYSDIVLMITLMQQGMNPKDIYKEIYDENKQTKQIDRTELNVTELLA